MSPMQITPMVVEANVDEAPLMVAEVLKTLSERVQPQSVDDMLKELESFEFDQIEITGYEPHPKIAMKMSV